jgi:chromosome segregation ATPase
MSTTPPFRPSQDTTRLEAAHLDRLRDQVQADMAALRERESNLRAYENRLRSGEAAAAVPRHQVPEVAAELHRLQRGTQLLEAERAAVRDDRLKLRQDEADLKKREADLKAREERLAARERTLAASEAWLAAQKPPEPSIKIGLNELPFAGIFRGARKSA